ncbi:MAG TPA: protein phosphatase 2C domain-containing protein [Kofleriaceae bacterium]|nr:protein phosphatase 2C domain-containing protein [Kofleriaceae bacterium]
MTAEAADEATRVTLEAWLVTDVGVVRDHNEDSAFMEPSQGFFIVADGMGGHAAGEVASAMAVETVRTTLEAAKPEIEAFKQGPTDAGRRGLVQLLQSAVLQAHQSVFQRGQAETDKQGMGTTLDVVLIAGGEAFVAHVGDSRTYLVREGRSSQITTDHTVAEVLVIEGKLTIEEAQVSPLRTILVNAIGVSADVGVEMAHVTLKKGDRLLLCSDGLHDYFPVEDEIAQRMSAEKPGEALKEMVELAKTRGGHDNITGVAVHVIDLIEAAVPKGLSEDSTQPVDIQGNPFAADEPTQTAANGGNTGTPPETPTEAPPGTPTGGNFRRTEPMRAINEVGTLPTLPPPNKRKDDVKKGDKKDAAKKTDVSTDVAADDAQLDKKGKSAKDETPKPADKKPDETPKPADKPDGDPKAADPKSDAKSDESGDAVPVEAVGTADTGRVTAPKKD